MPTTRWPTRAPSNPPGKAVRPASRGPGAIMKPARRTDSCHTPVRNSTPPSTSAPKPPKKTSELTSARATARCRMTAGSRIGLGWRNERTISQAPATAARVNAPRIRRAEPAPVRALDDGGHQAGDRHREQHGTEQVGLVRRRVAHLAQQAHPEDEGEQAEGQVDEEHPTPAGLHQEPADRGPERGGGAAHRRPQPDGCPLALGAEGGEEEPEGGGEHERTARGLQHAGGDEEAERGRDGAERGGGGEDGQAQEEGLLAPGAVGPAARGHERGGEHDRVGAQHPRQRAQALPVEAGRDAREGDVDDEEVEGGQEDPRQDDEGGQGRAGA